MLVSKKELASLKLKAIKSDDLKEFAGILGIDARGTASNLIKKLIDIPQNKIDEFIKRKYQAQIKERQKVISDENLRRKLLKVQKFKWGVVQGQLDQKIQREYSSHTLKSTEKTFKLNGIKTGIV